MIFKKILTEKDTGLITFYEKKAITGNVANYNKIPRFVERYSSANMKVTPPIIKELDMSC